MVQQTPDRLTQAIQWMWSLGDYADLARRLEPCAVDLANACHIHARMHVLDIAAGNGNFAFAAARRGARVTASDLTPHMLELGKERAAHEGLTIEWIQANAEELPFETEAADVAASVFGAMFAFLPDRVASELVRVVRPGGLIAMANYSPTGFLAAMAKLLEELRPPENASPPSPFLWGDPDVVHRRFAGLPVEIRTVQRTGNFAFSSLDEAWAFWERTNPPLSAMRAMLPPPAYAEVARKGRDLMIQMNHASDGSVRLEWDWLMVLADRT